MAAWWLLAGVLLTLSACGARPAPQPVAARAAAAAPTTIDGRYHGIARLIRASIAGCPRSGARVVMVEGGTLSLNYRGPSVSYALSATVASDGSVHGSDGRGTIEGQLSGSHMDLTVSSDFCEVRYALDRG